MSMLWFWIWRFGINCWICCVILNQCLNPLLSLQIAIWEMEAIIGPASRRLWWLHESGPVMRSPGTWHTSTAIAIVLAIAVEGLSFSSAWGIQRCSKPSPAWVKNIPPRMGGKGNTKAPLRARWDTIHPLRKQEPECFVFTWGTKSHLQNKAQKAQSPTRILWGHSLNDFHRKWLQSCLTSTHLHHYHHHSDYCYCYYYHYFL